MENTDETIKCPIKNLLLSRSTLLEKPASKSTEGYTSEEQELRSKAQAQALKKRFQERFLLQTPKQLRDQNFLPLKLHGSDVLSYFLTPSYLLRNQIF